MSGGDHYLYDNRNLNYTSEFRNNTSITLMQLSDSHLGRVWRGCTYAALSMSVKQGGCFRLTLDSKYHLLHHINYINKKCICIDEPF